MFESAYGGVHPGPRVPGLAADLAGTDPETVDDAALVDGIMAWERLSGWVEAMKLRWIAALASRRPPAGGPVDVGSPRGDWSEFVADELAFALRVARQTAEARLELATTLRDRLPATEAALYAGELSLVKARRIAEATDPLPEQVAQLVEARVLAKAADQTPGELGAALRRAVAAADPVGFAERARAARAERCVRRFADRDGMGSLWARLAAEDAEAAFRRVDAQAHALRDTLADDDDRSLDALRADVLVDLLTGRAAGPHLAEGAPASAPAPAAAAVQVYVSAETLLGVSNAAGDLPGMGPLPADVVRRLAVDATLHRVVTDPITGAPLHVDERSYRPSARLARFVQTRDRTCRAPGCRRAAERCDIDHVVGWPQGATSAANLACLCRHHHRLKQRQPWQLTVDENGVVTWTAPTGHLYHVWPEPLDDDGAWAQPMAVPTASPIT